MMKAATKKKPNQTQGSELFGATSSAGESAVMERDVSIRSF
jgi:hypothetical protein